MSKVEVKRVFDGWDDVDCEDCGRYWDSSCDGLKPGMRKSCGSYVATRKVVTLDRLDKLEEDNARSNFNFCIINCCIIAIMGWLILLSFFPR